MISMPELFASLKEGDLLMIPITRLDNQEVFTMFSSVLRVGSEGELYLSYPDERQATALAYAGCNPFRWDPSKGVLVDKNGDVPRWYTVDITLERGGATKQAMAYAKVPRFEHMSPEHTFNDKDYKRFFLQKDERAAQLEGLLRNGEAGPPSAQIALALDVLGIPFSQQQAMGLAYFMEGFAARRTLQATLVSIPDGLIEKIMSAEKTPPQTH